jgi:hypothetical protein
MKNLICLLVLLITNTYAQRAELDSFQTRLDEYKKYESEAAPYIENLKELESEYSSYKHDKIIQQDQDLLDQGEVLLKDQIKIAEGAAQTFLISSVQKRIDDLKKYVDFQEDYVQKLNERQKIEDGAIKRSKRFQKFIQAVKDRKYTKQDILKVMLFKEEKELADEYLELNGFLVRETNTYAYNKEQISKLIPEIENSFKYPKGSYEKIENARRVYTEKKSELENLKKLHKLVQYDVTMGTWESGLFSCKESSKPEYWRFENYPDLVALVNDGQIKSVLKIDPQNPSNKEYAYKCGDYGMFGGCLENTKKKLCEIDSDCNEALAEMEESFDQTDFFKVKKEEILNELKLERDQLRNSGNYINFLTEWEKMDKIGDLSTENYSEIFEGLFAEIKSINASSVKNFLYQANKKLEAKRISLLNNHKDEDSQKAINYFINDTKSFFEKVDNIDKLQVIASKHCYNDEFCENYAKWYEKASLFDKVSPVENLVADECPRLVLRLDQSNQILESYNCEVKESLRIPSAIEQLNFDISNSIKMLKY